MRAKTGRTLHEKGRILPVCQRDGDEERCYAAAVAAALRNELGGTRAAAKTIMRWTGAGERAVKAWLGGISGEHRRILRAMGATCEALWVPGVGLSHAELNAHAPWPCRAKMRSRHAGQVIQASDDH